MVTSRYAGTAQFRASIGPQYFLDPRSGFRIGLHSRLQPGEEVCLRRLCCLDNFLRTRFGAEYKLANFLPDSRKEFNGGIRVRQDHCPETAVGKEEHIGAEAQS